jgi:hypothetical protein
MRSQKAQRGTQKAQRGPQKAQDFFVFFYVPFVGKEIVDGFDS